MKEVTMRDWVKNISFYLCLVVNNNFEILSSHESTPITDSSDIKQSPQSKAQDNILLPFGKLTEV